MSSLLSSPHRGLSQRPAHARTIFVLLLLLLPQSCNSFISSQCGQLRHAFLNSRQAVNSCTRSDARQRPGTPTMQQADRSDWLSFRERLEEQYVTVGSEGKAARKVNSVTDKGEASSNVWKYDVGELIQAGTLLFSINTQHPHVDQQFHKSLVLVLSHNPRYVQGIILNRPSQFSTENGWRLWHGGNIQGFSAPRDLKHYLCLHKLEGEVAQRVSAKVVDGIYFTSLNSAESLVQAGHAKKEDFVVFLGYVGWTSGDLEARVDSGLNRNWFIASVGKTTKSQVCNACQQVCQEYSKRCTKCVRKSTLSSDMLLSRVFDDLQHFESTEEEAGIDIWNTWMSAMGLRNYTAQSESLVEDAMMKEWARRILIDRPEEFTTPQRTIPMLKAGLLLRANGPAPFIFAREYLHKSVVLILEDNNEQTVGVVLNRPMRTSAVKLSKFSPDLFGGRWLSFGGEYSAGNLSLIAIHSSEELARRKVGTRVSADSQFYICSMADVAKSVSAGVATESDYLFTSGFCVWPKHKIEETKISQDMFYGSSIPSGTMGDLLAKEMFVPVARLTDEEWIRLRHQQEPTSRSRRLLQRGDRIRGRMSWRGKLDLQGLNNRCSALELGCDVWESCSQRGSAKAAAVGSNPHALFDEEVLGDIALSNFVERNLRAKNDFTRKGTVRVLKVQ